MTQLRPSQLFYFPDNQLMILVNDSPLVVEPISVATTSRNTGLLLCRKPHVLQELTYPTFTSVTCVVFEAVAVLTGEYVVCCVVCLEFSVPLPTTI